MIKMEINKTQTTRQRKKTTRQQTQTHQNHHATKTQQHKSRTQTGKKKGGKQTKHDHNAKINGKNHAGDASHPEIHY